MRTRRSSTALERERILARGQRLDRCIPFLDSPLTHVGARIATAIGIAWGGLWSTGRVERHVSATRGTVLWVFRGLPRWAFPRGGVCVGSCYLTDTNTSPAVLRHEHVHVAQWHRYGALFPVLYHLSGRNPLRNRFEIEAGLVDGNYLPRKLSRADRAPRSTRTQEGSR